MSTPDTPDRPHRAQAPLAFAKHASFVFWLVNYLAASVVVTFRSRPGFDTLAPTRIVIGAAMLLFWSDMLSFLVNSLIGGFVNMIGMGFIRLPYVSIPDSPLLTVFALCMALAAFVKRRRAWRRLVDGVGEHMDSLGTSPLRPLLPWMRADYVNRFVDPGVCAVAGYALYAMNYDGVLGVWLMLSAAALAFTEQARFEWTLSGTFQRHNIQAKARMEAQLLADIRASREREKARGSHLAGLRGAMGRELPHLRTKFAAQTKSPAPVPAEPAAASVAELSRDG